MLAIASNSYLVRFRVPLPNQVAHLTEIHSGCRHGKLKDQITPHVKHADCYETKVMTWDGASR